MLPALVKEVSEKKNRNGGEHLELRDEQQCQDFWKLRYPQSPPVFAIISQFSMVHWIVPLTVNIEIFHNYHI